MRQPFKQVARRYGIAVAAVVAAAAVRAALFHFSNGNFPYLPFIPAVIVAAWLGGIGPGILACVVSAVVAQLWVNPTAPAATPSAAVLGLALFVLTDLMIVLTCELARHARRRADSAAATLARLGAIVGASDDAIISTTPSGVVECWNAAAERTFGYTAEEIVGRSIDLLVPDDRSGEEGSIVEWLLRGDPVRHFETVRLRKDGSQVAVSMTAALVRDAQGNVTGVSTVARDVTARRQFERELLAAQHATERSLAQWQAVIGSMNEGLVVSDAQGNLLEWNRAALLLHDYTSMDEVRANLDTFTRNFEMRTLAGEPVPFTDWPLMRVLRGETFVGWELVVRRLDAAREWVLSYSGTPVRDADGSIMLGLLTLHDVTRRKADERMQAFLMELNDATRSLGRPEEILRLVVGAVGRRLAVARCWYGEVDEPQGHVTVHGDYHQGVPSLTGRYRLERFGPELVRDLRAGRTVVIDDVSDDPRVTTGPARTFVAYGTRSTVSVPLVKEGRLLAMLVLQHDQPRRWSADDVLLLEHVAERTWLAVDSARAHEGLRRSEARYARAAAAGRVGVWEVDLATHALYLAPNLKSLLGYADDELANDFDAWGRLVHPDDLVRLTAAREAHLAGAATKYEVEVRRRCRDGSYRWFLTQATALRDAAGKAYRLIGSDTDINERKCTEQQRDDLLERERLARAELEHAGRTKDEFLATLSHELRTPLNAILGYSQLLRAAPHDTAEVAQGLEVIERNARVQTQIIEDLLDMSRIISGKVRMNVGRVCLATVVRAALETVRTAAGAKDIRIDAALDASAIPAIDGDPGRLQQVVWNLLSNAIKFTPRGGQVRVELTAAGPQVELAVIDTGRGMPAEFLPYAFDRFRQADASTTRGQGGLGLGLAIVKNLVELHGGTVAVESPGEGRGSTFTVSLPAAHEVETDVTLVRPRVERDRGRPGADVTLDGVRVLVVDDEPDARELVRRVLAGCGAEVVTAGSVEQGLDAVDRARPDVLLSDIGMPARDGFDLIRTLRARGGDTGALPAAALTALARPEDRARALNAGYHVHIAKPVDAAELIAAVARLAGRGHDVGRLAPAV